MFRYHNVSDWLYHRSLEGLKEEEEKKKVKGELLKVKVDEHVEHEKKGEEEKVKEGRPGYKN